MKNIKSILSILAVIVLLFMLGSCKPGGTNQNSGKTSDPQVIYSEDFTPSLVLGDGYNKNSGSIAMRVFNIVSEHCGEFLTTCRDDVEKAEREIVLGNTSREISKKATSLLNKEIRSFALENGIEATDPDIVGFTIVSDGKSLAMLFSDEYISEVAFEYLKENYLSESSLKLSNDHVYVDVFSLTEYVDERDEKIIDEKWAAIETEIGESVGPSVVSELKKLYSLYSDSVISWIANLYCPVVGGFYHSNSGRNNYGFLPDVESTYSALEFIDSSGMNDDTDGDFADVIPENIKNQIINFVYNLQAEDGYFYHPQWGDNITDGRRGRDLSSSTILLKAFGVETKYPYPGTGASTVSFLRRSSTASAVSMVSRVVAASSVPEKFQSAKNFSDWLFSLNLTTGAYHAGSDLQSLINEMKSYGKMQGIDFMGMAVDHLNLTQNKSNGLWHTEVNYYGTNGLHKIAYFYNQAKAEFPNAQKAIESTFDSLLTDEVPAAAVDVYNAWSCVGYIITNIQNYSSGTDSEKEAKSAEIIDKARELAPVAIKGTAEKVAMFRKSDGSFSYMPDYSTPTAEGVNVAVKYQVEGDLNGTGTMICALVEHIFQALDIEEYIVPRYTTSDRFRFISELEALGEIVKDEYEEPEPITFEEDDIGGPSVDVVVFKGSTGDGAEVVEHRRGDDNKHVLRFNSNNDGGDSVQINNTSALLGANIYVFEGDIYIEDIDTNYVLTITMSPTYMLSLKNISGRITLFEETTNSDQTSITRDLGVVLEKERWYSLKIEHYRGDHETVRTVVYIDGTAVAVSDGYYNKPKDGSVGQTPDTFNLTEIYVMSGKSCTLLLDNLRSYETNGEYATRVLNNEKHLNVDDPNSTWGIVPEGTKVNMSIPVATDDKTLDTSVFETTLNFTEATGGSHLAKISFLDEEDNTLSEYTVYCHDYDKALVGNPRFRIRVFKDGYGYMSGANVGNKMEQDISIKIEYCFATGEIKVITNGKEVTKTLVEEASKVPVAKVVFTNLDAYSKFTYSDVKAENIATGRAGTTPEIPVRQETVTKAVTTVDEGANLLTTEFKVNYSKVAGGQNMNKLSFLDSAGNVINSIFIYCHDYDDSQSTATERYRIRAFADEVGFLTGANVGNKLGMDITFRIEYNWTSGAMKVYTNGNLAEHTFDKNATDTPIASVAFEALLDEVAYSVDIVTADATYVNAEQPPEEEENPSEDDTTSETLTLDLTDVSAEAETQNTVKLALTVNYSTLTQQEPLHSIELLDADGNVLSTLYLFANDYQSSTDTATRWRIRISGKNADGYISLIGGSLGNKGATDISFELNYDLAAGTVTITCNGTVGSAIDISSYEGNVGATSTPAVQARVTPISENAACEIDFTQLEFTKIKNNI